MTHPDTATRTEFAAILGCKRPYVTQLAKEGRLVFAGADRKLIRVAESIERIEATRDPAMQGVAEHHAVRRAAKAAAPSAPPPGSDAEADTGADEIGNTYQAARAVKEQYLARAAKRDYELSIGKLLQADDVRSAIAGAATTLRARLETLPDTLGPQLAGVADEQQARAILAEAIEHALGELARQFAKIGEAQPFPIED